MTQRARLTAWSCAVTVATGITVGGATSAWWRVHDAGYDINSSAVGRLHIPDRVHAFSSSDLGSPIAPLAILALIAAILVFIVGPRVRAIAMGTVAVLSATILGLIGFVPGAPGGTGRTESGTGLPLTLAGALCAAIAAGCALPLAAKVPRARLPDAPPDD